MHDKLGKATIAGDLDVVEQLLAQGEPVNGRDRFGQTALMLASVHGRADVVDRLLSLRADMDVTAKFGLSALMLAIVNRHTEIAKALVEAGADTTLRGKGAPGFHEKTAMDMAREAGFADLIDTITIVRIERAFAERQPPDCMTDSKQLSDVEYDEVMSFDNMRWPDVTFDQVERNSDAIFWFAPEAFCYYLPGFLCACIREKRCDANAYDAIIGMLDRSAEPTLWDDFFLPRWPLLTDVELDAVGAWINWFEAEQPDSFHDNTFDRVRKTLTLLSERQLVDN